MGSADAKQCEPSCFNGDGDACALLGLFNEVGLNGRNQHREAADFFERGCRFNSGEACEGLARLLMRGEGRPKDERRAADLLEQLCEAGRGTACAAVAVAYIAGRGRLANVRQPGYVEGNIAQTVDAHIRPPFIRSPQTVRREYFPI